MASRKRRRVTADLPGYTPLPRSKGRRKFRAPDGKIITEYRYRTIKAQAAGYRNYTQQRRFRERPAFMKLRFDALSHEPDADLSIGSPIERAIMDLLSHRESSGASQVGPVPGYRPFPGPDGWPAEAGTGAMIGAPGDRFAKILDALGLPDWWKWRYWYSEVAVG